MKPLHRTPNTLKSLTLKLSLADGVEIADLQNKRYRLTVPLNGLVFDNQPTMPAWFYTLFPPQLGSGAMPVPAGVRLAGHHLVMIGADGGDPRQAVVSRLVLDLEFAQEAHSFSELPLVIKGYNAATNAPAWFSLPAFTPSADAPFTVADANGGALATGIAVEALGIPQGDADTLGGNSADYFASAADLAALQAQLESLDWQNSVLDKDFSEPPVSPAAGDRYLVAALASGAWLGRDENIAEYDGTHWSFTAPHAGFAVWVQDEGAHYRYDGSAWSEWIGSGSGGEGDADTLNGEAGSHYLSRSNHTGSQAMSTVSGLQSALDGKAASSHTHSISNVTGLATSLDDLMEATLPPGGTTGQVLAKNSATHYDVEWVDPSSGGGGEAQELGDLGDVSLSSPSSGQVLKFNGSAWANANETGGGSGHTIADEGTPLAARPTLDFQGAGVTVTDDESNNTTVVSIAGGIGAGVAAQISAKITADQSIPNATWADIVFDELDIDEGGGFSWNNGEPTKIYATETFNALVIASVEFASNNTGVRALNIGKNGLAMASERRNPTSTDETNITYSIVLPLEPGDWVTASVRQLSGSALDIRDVTRLHLVRLASGNGGGGLASRTVEQEAHGLSVGQHIKVTGDDTYAPARADSAANAEVAGCVTSVANTGRFTYLPVGPIVEGSGYTAGEVRFLDSATPGTDTPTPPDTPGEVVKPVLLPINATQAILLDYIGYVVPEAGSSGEGEALNPDALPWWIEMHGWYGCQAALSTDVLQIGIYGNWNTQISIDEDGEAVYIVPLAAGTWDILINGETLGTYGIATVVLDSDTVGTLDFYAAPGFESDDRVLMLTGVTVEETRPYQLKIQALTKNPSSTGYDLLLNRIALRRTA